MADLKQHVMQWGHSASFLGSWAGQQRVFVMHRLQYTSKEEGSSLQPRATSRSAAM